MFFVILSINKEWMHTINLQKWISVCIIPVFGAMCMWVFFVEILKVYAVESQIYHCEIGRNTEGSSVSNMFGYVFLIINF